MVHNPNNLSKAVKKLIELSKESVDTTFGTSVMNINARYGFVQEDGFLRDFSYPCHMYMKYCSSDPKSLKVSRTPVDVTFSRSMIPTNSICTIEASEAYFKWIYGPNSPWCDFLKTEPMMVEDHNINSYEFRKKYGLVFYDLDQLPSNYHHNLLVASRMPKEWPGLIQFWYDLVTVHSINHELALIFSGLINCYKKPEIAFPVVGSNELEYCFNTIDKYDWPLDATSKEESYVHNFIRHEYNYANPPLKEQAFYAPVNIIWGRKPGGNVKSYPNVLKDLYGSKLGCIKVATSSFDNTTRNQWVLSSTDLISLIKQENERLISAINIAA